MVIGSQHLKKYSTQKNQLLSTTEVCKCLLQNCNIMGYYLNLLMTFLKKEMRRITFKKIKHLKQEI